MKLATPGFVGSRLTEAIEIRNITKTALAEMAGISPGAITQYEKGISSPQVATLERLCKVLGLPQAFFLCPVVDGPPDGVFFRSFTAATQGARRKSRRRLVWLHDAVDFLSEYVDLPRLNMPDADLVRDWRDLTPQAVEGLATTLRKYWKLGEAPISNVAWLLENNGIIVRRNTIYDESIDAFSCHFQGSGRAAVFLAADKPSAVRSRFDAAHELGHLLLHRAVPADVLRNRAELKIIEDQADRFAGAFLLPAQAFEDDLHSIDLNEFVRLKAKWKVSVRAMVMRAKHLGIIFEDEARTLFINANRRWGAKKEPLDEELPSESPCLLRDSILALLEHSIVTRHDVLTALPYGPRDVAQIFGLEEDFFQERRPDVRLIQPVQDGEPASVIDLQPRMSVEISPPIIDIRAQEDEGSSQA